LRLGQAGRVPDLPDAVGARRRQAPAVATENEVPDLPFVRAERAPLSTGLRVPDIDAPYPITVTGAGTLTAANYDFPSARFGQGTLTVTHAAATTVSVGSTLSPSAYGQSVSFTATVAGGGPMPTGTVQFVVDGANLGAAVALVNGAATSAAIATLNAGNSLVVARYSGDTNYDAATGSFGQEVNQAALALQPNNASMDRYDAVPALTYALSGFVNGEDATTAGVSVVASPATTATSTSPAGYYPITASVTSLAAANNTLGAVGQGTLTVRPKVVDARVAFGGRSVSLGGLGRDLPFVNIRSLSLTFSDDVNVTASMRGLSGQNVSRYTFSGITSGTLIPYIYPPAPTSGFSGAVLGGGVEVTADDLALTGGVALAAGQSVGLARVTYSVAAGAGGTVPVPFVSIGTGTALSDASGRLISFATATVIPEPSGLALAATGFASALVVRRLRGRRAPTGG
jgi:hypothetical protein